MTRKRLIKRLMAKRVSRNDAVSIAKFIHDKHLAYDGTKVYVVTRHQNGKLTNDIAIHHKEWHGFWYEYYKGRFNYGSVQGTSSLNYMVHDYDFNYVSVTWESAGVGEPGESVKLLPLG